ncbi:MAG: hypothetical protein ACI9UA_004364 [Pseudoalteromonas tetraodonis]
MKADIDVASCALMKNWILWTVLGGAAALGSDAIAAEHVVMVSVDGLRHVAIEQLVAAGELKNFARLQAKGAWTHNGRTEYTSTSTVPNHVSMVTSRRIDGSGGHNYTSNSSPAGATTLHTTKGLYVASAFDVAHDHGLRTAVFRSKSKLIIIDQSYTAATGAEDTTGDDDGRGKIDATHYAVANGQAGSLIDLVETELATEPVHLSFIHLVDPDSAGHGRRWETQGYLDAVRRVDGYLGRLLNLVENTEPYAGRTTVILTADHGGEGQAHSDVSNSENYTIPFYVWGADVPAAADLYALNQTTRLDPQAGRPDPDATPQPIRNGEIGNLALHLLGLPPIPGSMINPEQDLRVDEIDPDKPRIFIRPLPTGQGQIRWTSDSPGVLQRSQHLGSWQDVYQFTGGHGSTNYWIDDSPRGAIRGFFRLKF